jgi:hypothetical protein
MLPKLKIIYSTTEGLITLIGAIGARGGKLLLSLNSTPIFHLT